MEENRKFICSYCGAKYDTAPERARCELRCDEKQKQEAERHRQFVLHSEQRRRAQEVTDALQRYKTLWTAYLKDYGEPQSFHDILTRLFQ